MRPQKTLPTRKTAEDAGTPKVGVAGVDCRASFEPGMEPLPRGVPSTNFPEEDPPRDSTEHVEEAAAEEVGRTLSQAPKAGWHGEGGMEVGLECSLEWGELPGNP